MNYKKYKLLFIIFFLIVKKFVFCDDVKNELFVQSVELYNKLNYAGCEEKLLELNKLLLKNGKVSFEVFYNLGNASFRQNKLGWARYYYELAKKVNYYNKDVNYNLKLIQKLTQNTNEQNLVEEITKILSVEHLFIIIFVFNVMFFTSLVFYNSFILWIRRISGIIFVLFFILGIVRYTYECRKEAIIVESSQMFSSPEENLTTKSVFLPEAKKVLVLSEKDDFYAVYVLQDKIHG
ncbi:MAG: hypothetical protein N2Z73_02660, partial [Endomicrobia bacterium]|nr:hypothetical protein [Endomicrobiia bacterium]